MGFRACSASRITFCPGVSSARLASSAIVLPPTAVVVVVVVVVVVELTMSLD